MTDLIEISPIDFPDRKLTGRLLRDDNDRLIIESGGVEMVFMKKRVTWSKGDRKEKRYGRG